MNCIGNCKEGNPKCLLGQLTGQYQPKNIQVPARPARDIINKYIGTVPKKKYSILIVGQNPGLREDFLNIPFVGDSGDFLSSFLEMSGIPIDDCIIDNLVKCITPKNRNPSAAEIKACIPYVYENIKKYEPKVIMLLGNSALKLFNLREGGISKCRGKVFRKKLPLWPEGPEFLIVPSFHPATFVYRYNKKQWELALTDYQLAAELATGRKSEGNPFYQAKYEVCDSLEKVEKAVEVMEFERIFGMDTESPDLNFMKSPLRLLQLSAGKGKTYLIPFYSHDPNSLGEWKLKPFWNNPTREKIRDILNRLFSNKLLKCILHNASYDMKVLKRWLNIIISNEIYDTQIIHHLIYEYPPHGLKELADMEFHCGDWEAPVREIVGGEEGDSNLTWDNVPDEYLWPYGANDAEHTWGLFDRYWPIIESKPHLKKLYFEESLPAIHAKVKAEWMGNKIDLSKVDEMEKIYKKRLDFFLTQCRQIVGKPDLNPQSPDQVVEALRARATPENEILEKITDKTKSKGFSTGKDILLEIDDEFAESILQYRKYRKLISTYIDRIRKDIDENNRVRYSFNLAGTTSGRISCRFLHQIPRIDKEAVNKEEVILRQIFIEDEGYDFVYWDYDQVEMWVFAYKSKCKDLIETLESGKDIHRNSAAAAMGISIEQVSDHNRTALGKVFNFGTIFGSEGYQISKSEYETLEGKKQKVGKERAFMFVQNFNKKYPEIEQYKDDLVNNILVNNCIYRTEFGREIRIPELTTADGYREKKLKRELLNKSIQSPAGAITIRTICKIDEILELNGIGNDKIRLINTVHDSGSYGVRKNLTPWFIDTVKKVAERTIPELFNKKFKIKIGVGKNWADAELKAK